MVRLLFDIFCIILTVHLVWLLVTHAVRCYALGLPTGLPDRLINRGQLGAIFATLCQELAGLLLLSVLWPFPIRRLHLSRIAQERPPILLVPGYGIQRSGVVFLSWWLRQKGWSTVIAPLGPSSRLLGSASRSVEELASRLSRAIDHVAEITGAKQVHLIGQGLGGVVARYYVEQMEMSSRVASVITLGTAHHGTGLAVFGQGLIEALMPDSPLIGALEASLATIAVPYVSISADLDACVVPPASSLLGPPHLDIRIPGIGHHSLLFSARAFRAVREQLMAVESGMAVDAAIQRNTETAASASRGAPGTDGPEVGLEGTSDTLTDAGLAERPREFSGEDVRERDSDECDEQIRG